MKKKRSSSNKYQGGAVLALEVAPAEIRQAIIRGGLAAYQPAGLGVTNQWQSPEGPLTRK